jgi:hypothetical protein
MAWTRAECVKCMAENEVWIKVTHPQLRIFEVVEVKKRGKCDGHCRKENHEDRNK